MVYPKTKQEIADQIKTLEDELFDILFDGEDSTDNASIMVDEIEEREVEIERLKDMLIDMEKL